MSDSTSPTPANDPSPPTPARVKLAVAAAILGVAALGVSAYFTFRRHPGNAQSLSAKDISAEMPLADVRKSGDVILGTITDGAWIELPEPARRAQVEAAASNVRAQHATNLIVLDGTGAPIISLIVRKDPVVTFLPTAR